MSTTGLVSSVGYNEYILENRKLTFAKKAGHGSLQPTSEGRKVDIDLKEWLRGRGFRREEGVNEWGNSSVRRWEERFDETRRKSSEQSEEN